MNAAITILFLISFMATGFADTLKLDCKLQTTVDFLGECTINSDASGCVQYCQNLGGIVGQFDSENNCVCTSGTTFDPNFCCTNVQCVALCDSATVFCNQETNRCEKNISSTTCNNDCMKQNMVGGSTTTGNCVCTDCNSGTSLSDRNCGSVSSIVLGVASTGNGDTCLLNISSPISPDRLCEDIYDIMV